MPICETSMYTSLARPLESFFLISAFLIPAQSGYASKSPSTAITSAGMASISFDPSVCSAIRGPLPVVGCGLVRNLDGVPPPVGLEVSHVHQHGCSDVARPHQRVVDMAEQRVLRLVSLHVADQPHRARFELLRHDVVDVPGDPW